MGGSWSNSTVTCTINQTGYFGGTLLIGSDAFLRTTNGSNFVDGGNLTNFGGLSIGGSLSQGAIYDDEGGIVTNFGSISSYVVYVAPKSTLNNTATGIVVSNGPASVIQDFGIVYNSGTIVEEGLFQIGPSAVLENNGDIENSGSIANEGSIVDRGSITDSCGANLGGSGELTGNPPTVSQCSSNATSVVPQFPDSLLALVALASVAAVSIFASQSARELEKPTRSVTRLRRICGIALGY